MEVLQLYCVGHHKTLKLFFPKIVSDFGYIAKNNFLHSHFQNTLNELWWPKLLD